MHNQVRKYLSEIGRKGGKKSRRALSSRTAAEMVKIREARRAFKDFYARCFWSYDPLLKIGNRRAMEVDPDRVESSEGPLIAAVDR